MTHPNPAPNTTVIPTIGNKPIGSFQPIKNEQGSKTIKDIAIPFNIGFSFQLEVLISIPTHRFLHNNERMLQEKIIRSK